MSYYLLGAGRGYTRFQFYQNGNLVYDAQLKSQVNETSKIQEGKETILEDGELCISGSSFRAEAQITLFNVKSGDAIAIAIVLQFLEQTLNGNYKLVLYPEYNQSLGVNQFHYEAIPTGNFKKKWTHEFLETAQEVSVGFKSVYPVSLSYPYAPTSPLSTQELGTASNSK